jgi:glycosyltransferase involved in cell wall biosynthesis
MRPIRFCMVTTFYPPASFGGDAIQVERLAHLLAGHGHEVTVVHAADAYRALGGKQPVPKRVKTGPIKVIPISGPTGSLSPMATYLSGRPLLSKRPLEKAMRGPFDVIHFHNPSLIGGPGVFGMGQAAVRLYTAHEQWLLCPTHVLWKNKKEVCERPTCTTCTLRYGRPPQPWRQGNFLERSMTELDALIVPSRTSADLHSRFADLVPIEHIPHFVPPTPESNGFGGGRPYFLFVGRHESIKGLDTLIEAFRKRGGEDLLIAGSGPDTEALQERAKGLSHVRFLGWQERDKLDSLYRHALAVVVPTRGHEAFGLVPVEGFSRGTPAIVRGFGALAELIEDSGAGFTYSSDEELHRALDLLAGDPDVRAALGDRARAAHLAHWTPEIHLRRYLELIEELAAWRGADSLARAAVDAAGDAHETRLLEMELLRS